MKNVIHNETECAVYFRRYQNNRLAIQLVDISDNLPYAVATVNLPEVTDLPENHVIIKSWSENAGMVEALFEAGIIDEFVRTHRTGYCEAGEHPLLVNPAEIEARMI